MRTLNTSSLDHLAVGAALLGAGGGGDPYIGKLLASWAIETYGSPQIVDPSEVPDDALCVMTGSMGAPTVAIERLPGGDELHLALLALERYLGKSITHLVGMEIGGINSMLPIASAARSGLPLVDCDGMGRAFPELQMCTPSLFGILASPMVIADAKGNTVVIDSADNHTAEKMARLITIEMGAVSYIALYPQSGKSLKESMIPRTLAFAENIGAVIAHARAKKVDPLAALLEVTRGVRLFEGKITDVDRRTVHGFARGVVSLSGIGPDTGSTLKVKFQNENLIAEYNGIIVATVPDLICFIEPSTGTPMTTEELRYGLRAAVIGIPCDSRWRTDSGLQLVGPKYFGYDLTYTPIENFVKPT
ncbi:MAG: DUF917 domain-containing protein [Acidimicrobiaceae bacterium]|nr:DUF917 domain-containing protein [Acidimicrobiaceae bacterium]